MSTARITADQLNSPQLQGQSVRAVGKLMQMDAQQGSVQLELPGAQRAWRAGSHPHVTCIAPRVRHK